MFVIFWRILSGNYSFVSKQEEMLKKKILKILHICYYLFKTLIRYVNHFLCSLLQIWDTGTSLFVLMFVNLISEVFVHSLQVDQHCVCGDSEVVEVFMIVRGEVV